MAAWQIYLVATVLVECAIAFPLAPRGHRRRTFVCCVLANLFTHPLLSMLLAAGVGPLVVLELHVIAAEAVAYRFAARLSWRRALLLAFVTNAVTWAIGAIV